jgi:hypothetical protein
VDRTHFKVHRFFLERDSKIFRNLQTGADGKTEATAICLEDLQKEEFVTLLNFFYDGFVLTIRSHPIYKTEI